MSSKSESKIDYKEGNTYIIDADFANGGPVVLVKIHGKHFCRVKDPDTASEWETMLDRLSLTENKE